jgi:hypothetical protein
VIGSLLPRLTLGPPIEALGGAMGALVMVLGYLVLFAAGAMYHWRRRDSDMGFEICRGTVLDVDAIEKIAAA